MPQFIVFMHENDNAWEKTSLEERQKIMEKYFSWARKLRERNQMRGGEVLAKGGRVLRTQGTSIVDGPFTETKEVVTGFFIIEAADLTQATEIARECPALGHGETVILRQIAVIDADGTHSAASDGN